ncbi:MAG TPA: ATP-binding protein [Magnetospirillaceae bacterium]|nr:ATP-binding protein [Magnetospirillaceae bacterium]
MFLRARVGKGVIAMAAVIGSLLLCAAPTLAAPYGSGGYNKCDYACSRSQPTQSVTLPSGLTVTINLTSGQKIPHDGYVVIVQPADGQAGKLKQVGFYVNGALQYTGTPNEIGAVRWLWQPTETTGNVQLSLIITAEDGSVSTQSYTLTICTPDPVPTDKPADNPLVNVSRVVLGFASSLPTPVLYGAPYFLFALLLGNILLLLFQTQREVREVATLRRIIDIERKTGQEKTTFVSLASHYLRTPMSIIQGGFDLLQNSTTLTPGVMTRAERTIDSLRLKIDSLLARSDAASQIAGARSDDEPLPSAWRSPGLYLPIVFIGLFVVAFNYISANVDSLSVNQVTIILQMTAFCLLIVLFYQAFRRRQLHGRDVQGMQRALAHEQAINQTRDELITESTSLLGDDLQSLRELIDGIPASGATAFIRDGIARFRSVLVKFAIAGQLRGAHASQQSTPTTLSTILNHLPQGLTGKLSQQGVSLRLDADTAFIVQNPQLVTYVLASLIDNAAAYSKPQAAIAVAAHESDGQLSLTVTDHGAGIPPAKLSLLFRPFSQTQDTERYTHDGMGFSLYLDKLIMTYLGGDISLRSKPGVETVATLRLPTA